MGARAALAQGVRGGAPSRRAYKPAQPGGSRPQRGGRLQRSPSEAAAARPGTRHDSQPPGDLRPEPPTRRGGLAKQGSALRRLSKPTLDECDRDRRAGLLPLHAQGVVGEALDGGRARRRASPGARPRCATHGRRPRSSRRAGAGGPRSGPRSGGRRSSPSATLRPFWYDQAPQGRVSCLVPWTAFA